MARSGSRATSSAAARLALTAGDGEAGSRLIDVLAGWLPAALGRPLSRAALRRLVVAGAVQVDGRPARPGQPMPAGARITARVPDQPAARREPPRLDASAILFEDEALIAVAKPPGLPMHGTADPARPHFVGLLKALLAERDGLASGHVYLGLHQRLDRDTSGVVLFARRAEANPGLAAAFESRQVEKVYLALTARPARLPPAAWEVARGIEPGRERVRVTAAGLPALTRFRRVETHPTGLLVEARPQTGRKHQVRAHLAWCGAPILGDAVYGATAVARRAPRVMLHARRLALRHPVTGAPLVVEAPPPPDFAHALDRLRDR